MTKENSSKLTSAQLAELTNLAALPDDQIDTADIPEQHDWSGAQRGVFYRPIKKQLTLRVDAEIIAWFKAHASEGEGYQTRMNIALRDYVARQSAMRIK
jgi:uncharacterized protein (DUF4415 family)